MIYLELEYINFINMCRDRIPAKGERHHIRPRSLGGSDTNDNLLLLSYADHLHAHYILYKLEVEHSNPGPMTKAFFRMMGKRKDEEYCATYHGSIYQEARANFSIAQSLKLKGRKHTKEHVEKRILRGEKHPFYGRKFTEAELRNLSEKNKKPKEDVSNMRIAQQKRFAETPGCHVGFGNPRVNKNVYVFVHPEHGVYIGPVLGLKLSYGIPGSKIHNLIDNKGGALAKWSLNNFSGRSYNLKDYKNENIEDFNVLDYVK